MAQYGNPSRSQSSNAVVAQQEIRPTHVFLILCVPMPIHHPICKKSIAREMQDQQQIQMYIHVLTEEMPQVSARPFRVLGLQQVAIGAESKSELTKVWEGLFGLKKTGDFKSEKENVDEDIFKVSQSVFSFGTIFSETDAAPVIVSG